MYGTKSFNSWSVAYVGIGCVGYPYISLWGLGSGVMITLLTLNSKHDLRIGMFEQLWLDCSVILGCVLQYPST